MDAQLKNFQFTSWVFDVKYVAEKFIEFRLDHQRDMYSSLSPERYKLGTITELEPFKKKNSKTKGTKIYFRNLLPHNPKDETGMFPTEYENIYYGDILYYVNNERKQVLVFFQFVFEESKMIVDVFDDYFTKKQRERNQVLKLHPWYKKKAPIKSALKSFKTLIMAFNDQKINKVNTTQI